MLEIVNLDLLRPILQLAQLDLHLGGGLVIVPDRKVADLVLDNLAEQEGKQLLVI